MKTALDPRHLRRIQGMEALFAFSFNTMQVPVQIEPIVNNLERIDSLITKYAPAWPIASMNRVDLAILRLAVYELLYTDTKEDITIDEAIELGKSFGSDQSPKFINAVLGNIASYERNP